MTLILVALWIAGSAIAWYWFLAAIVLDLLWLSIKLNFMAVIVRRSVEDVLQSLAAQMEPPAPPPPSA
jgi:hypothetical protein